MKASNRRKIVLSTKISSVDDEDLEILYKLLNFKSKSAFMYAILQQTIKANRAAINTAKREAGKMPENGMREPQHLAEIEG